MISQKFIDAVWAYRRGGGTLWRLAIAHDMSPSLFSATLTGARRADDDPRIPRIGATLGLREDECFDDGDSAVAS